MEKNKTGTSRLLELAFRHKILATLACVLSAVSSVISFSPFIAIYYIIQELLQNFNNLDSQLMIKYGWWACGGAIATILTYFLALMCSHLAAFNTLFDLKLEFADHLASLPLGFHTDNSTGKLRKIVDENIEKLEGFIAHQLPDLVGSLVAPIVAIIMLFYFEWRLGLAIFIGLVICFTMQSLAMAGGKSKKFMKIYQDSLDDMSNASVEYVRGISVVKAFNQTVFSFRKFHDTIKQYSDFVYQYTKSFSKYMAAFMTIILNLHLFVMPVAILIYTPSLNYIEYALAVIFYLILSLSMSTPFMKIMYVSSGLIQISEGIERMDKVLDVSQLPEVKTTKMPNSYDIEFDNVCFTYDKTKDVDALSNISFKAKQGQFTALVGPSGSGKSTIAHLIPRFYDINSGTIQIGNVNIKDLSMDDLMSLVSFVFQDVFLFKQSIYDNIGIGVANATKESIIEAAKAACCHDFIMELPHGYDTVIGTKGIHLSGGEKQRLVIARAILKNAPIIVLDEATAFADPENEDKIQRAFMNLMKDKTVIVIAHRLSTIQNADKIVVMNKGNIVEIGTHKELIKKDSTYNNMWNYYSQAMNWVITNKEVV